MRTLLEARGIQSAGVEMIGNTRLGLERAATGRAPAIDHFSINVIGFDRRGVEMTLKRLGVESSSSNDKKLLRFRVPQGIVVELKAV